MHGDELYDILPQTRGGYGRLQDFGIRFGYERVVLHLQPQVEVRRLQCNTARTLLLLDHEPLPWARWGEEFTAAMPDEIRQLQERAATADGVPREQAIRNRVSAIMPLYRLSRYRPTPTAAATRHRVGLNGAGDEPADTSGARPRPPAAQPGAGTRRRGARPRRVAREPAPDPPTAAPALTPAVDLPDVAWISAARWLQGAGDLEDQAARYHPGRHELTINADFRAITDLITHWQDRYKGVPGARAVIEAQVREWCEQILVEVVLATRNSTWRAEQLGALLSPTSFTAALLPRHLLHAMLQKRLAQKLGAPQPDRWPIAGVRRYPIPVASRPYADPSGRSRGWSWAAAGHCRTAQRCGRALLVRSCVHAGSHFDRRTPGSERRVLSRRMRYPAARLARGRCVAPLLRPPKEYRGLSLVSEGYH